MNTSTVKDPKQLLDEEIDDAFAEEEIVIADGTAPAKGPFSVRTIPATEKQLGVIAIALAACATLSIATTFMAVLVTRRLRMPKLRFFHFGMRGRHIGYGRYHFGRFGRAYMAYTYKLPDVRLQLPRATYKLPPIHVKLPAVHR